MQNLVIKMGYSLLTKHRLTDLENKYVVTKGEMWGKGIN